MVDSVKINKLKEILLEMESVLIAYSGGVDSTFLTKIAYDVLKEKVLAVTAKSLLHPASELKEAVAIAKKLGVRHLIIDFNELSIPGFAENPKNRCYLCKKELLGRLSQIAMQEGLNYILDGSNASDTFTFRPGRQAAKEFGVRSLLEEVGLTKEEIRELAKEFGLPNYNKPSTGCLASRFPYGKLITHELLKMVELAEEYFKGLGFSQIRVRHYDNLCRIEIDKSEMQMCMEKRDEIVAKLKNLGYTYVTLDLEGYRTGSMDEISNSPSF